MNSTMSEEQNFTESSEYPSSTEDDAVPGSSSLALYFPYKDVALAMLRYGLPILGCIGLLGNVTSFCVMVSKTMRVTSYSVYIAALAVLDIANLVHIISGQYFEAILGMKQPPLLDTCGGRYWYIAGSYTAGAWVVIAMTCERLIAICQPFQSRITFTVRRATVIVSCLVTAAYVVYVLDLLMYTMGRFCWNEKGTIPGIVNWPWFTRYGHFALATITYSFVPSICLLCLNSAIFIMLKRRNDSTALKATKSNVSAKYNEIGRLVVSVSVLYALLTIPISVHLLYYSAKNKVMIGHLTKTINGSLSILLMTANHCTNFIIYVAASPSFRATIGRGLGRANVCGRHATDHPISECGTGSDTANSGTNHVVTISCQSDPEGALRIQGLAPVIGNKTETGVGLCSPEYESI